MKDYIAKRDLTDFDILLMTIARYEVHSPFSVSASSWSARALSKEDCVGDRK